jgi:AraC-like DNA-binding protein
MLLVSTTKSVSEIGNECTFPNTSHFIKLFKKEYGNTPAAYRAMYRAEELNMAPNVAAAVNCSQEVAV